MDPEVKSLLKENIKLTKENNELLRKIRKYQKWSHTSKLIYWIIVILFVFGSWYFVKPYLNNLLGYYQNISNITSGIENLSNFSDIKNIQNLINQIP